MTALRWQLKTTATVLMKDLYQHAKPYGVFVIFGEHSVAFCPPPASRARSTGALVRPYYGTTLALRPEESTSIRIVEPAVKRTIEGWPAWATFAVQCLQHGLVTVAEPERIERGLVAEQGGSWVWDGTAWTVIGPTKRHKTTLFHSDGSTSIVADTTNLAPLRTIDSLVPCVWDMLTNHQPIVDGVALPARHIPEHILEAYYDTHPYKRPKTAAAD